MKRGDDHTAEAQERSHWLSLWLPEKIYKIAAGPLSRTCSDIYGLVANITGRTRLKILTLPEKMPKYLWRCGAHVKSLSLVNCLM